mmetsp:Transcript_90838/g.243273  ORF Transcript_90838/g.243273 Transcript_90838/m.243273 type:complete len:411 (-) Transcript_90838:200-1432(-)
MSFCGGRGNFLIHNLRHARAQILHSLLCLLKRFLSQEILVSGGLQLKLLEHLLRCVPHTLYSHGLRQCPGILNGVHTVESNGPGLLSTAGLLGPIGACFVCLSGDGIPRRDGLISDVEHTLGAEITLSFGHGLDLVHPFLLGLLKHTVPGLPRRGLRRLDDINVGPVSGRHRGLFDLLAGSCRCDVGPLPRRPGAHLSGLHRSRMTLGHPSLRPRHRDIRRRLHFFHHLLPSRVGGAQGALALNVDGVSCGHRCRAGCVLGLAVDVLDLSGCFRVLLCSEGLHVLAYLRYSRLSFHFARLGHGGLDCGGGIFSGGPRRSFCTSSTLDGLLASLIRLGRRSLRRRLGGLRLAHFRGRLRVVLRGFGGIFCCPSLRCARFRGWVLPAARQGGDAHDLRRIHCVHAEDLLQFR